LKKLVLVGLVLLLYVSVVVPFTAYMQNKPFVEKLGYVPSAATLRTTSLDQQYLVSSTLIMKVLFYYGSLFEAQKNHIDIPPNYDGMVDVIETAVKLDPYNMDGYYFAQAILTWDNRRIERANALLEYGMKYRDWDFYLPFFAGFNAAYFLKDYPTAAKYYQRAADLTGYALFSKLAGRYMYEAGKTELAIVYLKTMLASTHDETIRQSFQLRLAALEETRRAEVARDLFIAEQGRHPKSLAELEQTGTLDFPLVDPYGGKFFLDETGQVRTTSKFSFAGAKKSRQ